MEKDKKPTYKEIHGTTRVGDFLRSIGKGDILGKIVKAGVGVATGGGLGAIIDVISNSEELTPEQREYALKMAELDFREEEEITKRWQADMMSDNKASKNIRPYTLAALTLFLMGVIVADSAMSGFDVDISYIDVLKALLLLVYGAYFGGRSAEKITDKIAQIRKKL
jgi:hypothetical protein